jgi:hypothetical protein
LPLIQPKVHTNADWLVEDKQITPHIRVIDKSKGEDGPFARADFRYDEGTDTYTCTAGKALMPRRRVAQSLITATSASLSGNS